MELELPQQLRAAWIAAIIPILLASIPSPRLRFFHQLISGFANRGKTSYTSNKYTVPQRFFLHFYVLAVLWTTFLLLTTWFYAYKVAPLGAESFSFSLVLSQLTGGSHVFSTHKSHPTPVERRYILWRTVLTLLLMEVQVWRRLYETVYVFNYGRSARMHFLGYFTGLFFYAAAPLSLCSMCVPEAYKFAKHQVAELIVKRRDKLSTSEIDWLGYLSPLANLGWLQWSGAAICIWGWIHQHRCHVILGSLREKKEESDEYVIPRGDWFEIVSCPHYLAEIVIYGGILTVSGGLDFTVWLLFGFVVVNLVFAAAETHRWYFRKFENYPKTRHAILPFLY
ncbi:hypothetical protein ACHQM5_008238 [Ranunculus cassubicifolius]